MCFLTGDAPDAVIVSEQRAGVCFGIRFYFRRSFEEALHWLAAWIWKLIIHVFIWQPLNIVDRLVLILKETLWLSLCFSCRPKLHKSPQKLNVLGSKLKQRCEISFKSFFFFFSSLQQGGTWGLQVGVFWSNLKLLMLQLIYHSLKISYRDFFFEVYLQ